MALLLSLQLQAEQESCSQSTIKHVMPHTFFILKIYLLLFWSRLQNRTSKSKTSSCQVLKVTLALEWGTNSPSRWYDGMRDFIATWPQTIPGRKGNGCDSVSKEFFKMIEAGSLRQPVYGYWSSQWSKPFQTVCCVHAHSALIQGCHYISLAHAYMLHDTQKMCFQITVSLTEKTTIHFQWM